MAHLCQENWHVNTMLLAQVQMESPNACTCMPYVCLDDQLDNFSYGTALLTMKMCALLMPTAEHNL